MVRWKILITAFLLFLNVSAAMALTLQPVTGIEQLIGMAVKLNGMEGTWEGSGFEYYTELLNDTGMGIEYYPITLRIKSTDAKNFQSTAHLGNLPELPSLDWCLYSITLDGSGMNIAFDLDTLNLRPEHTWAGLGNPLTNNIFQTIEISANTAGVVYLPFSVDIYKVVPEPSTMLFLSTGLAALIGARRKIKHGGDGRS